MFWVPLLMAFLLNPGRTPAVGLAQSDSYAGLRSVPPPLRITWTVDATTVRMLGGGKDFADDLAATVYQRLREGGVPMTDGTFDPLARPFVSLDLWARGVSSPNDPKDRRRVFNFEMQVFVPAAGLRGSGGTRGRVTVWERGVYGACLRRGAQGIQDQVRAFMAVCDSFAQDWRRAHGLARRLRPIAGKPAQPGESGSGTLVH